MKLIRKQKYPKCVCSICKMALLQTSELVGQVWKNLESNVFVRSKFCFNSLLFIAEVWDSISFTESRIIVGSSAFKNGTLKWNEIIRKRKKNHLSLFLGEVQSISKCYSSRRLNKINAHADETNDKCTVCDGLKSKQKPTDNIQHIVR